MLHLVKGLDQFLLEQSDVSFFHFNKTRITVNPQYRTFHEVYQGFTVRPKKEFFAYIIHKASNMNTLVDS